MNDETLPESPAAALAPASARAPSRGRGLGVERRAPRVPASRSRSSASCGCRASRRATASRSRSPTACSPDTNIRLSATRSLLVEHGADLVEPTVELVDSTGARHPFLTAARAARHLVVGSPDAQPDEIHLELDDPVVTLTRARTAAGCCRARRARAGKHGRSAAPLAVDLGVHRARARRRRGAPDTLARELDRAARHGAGTTWDFALGRFAARLPGPKLTVAKADGRARLSEDRLALDHLRVRTDAGWVEAAGAGRSARRRTSTATCRRASGRGTRWPDPAPARARRVGRRRGHRARAPR